MWRKNRFKKKKKHRTDTETPRAPEGDESRLTATRVFGTLALLNALRFPIMDLGWGGAGHLGYLDQEKLGQCWSGI